MDLSAFKILMVNVIVSKRWYSVSSRVKQWLTSLALYGNKAFHINETSSCKSHYLYVLHLNFFELKFLNWHQFLWTLENSIQSIILTFGDYSGLLSLQNELGSYLAILAWLALQKWPPTVKTFLLYIYQKSFPPTFLVILWHLISMPDFAVPLLLYFSELISILGFKIIICCCSVTQSCQTLCNRMDCSMPCSSVLRYLPEFAQSHVHWVDDAIQPSHPVLPPSSLALFPSIKVFSNESAT